MKIELRSKRTESGQALAEYAALIPPALLLSVAVMAPMSEKTSEVYCDVTNELQPGECALPGEGGGGMSVWEAGEVDRHPTPTPEAGDEQVGDEPGGDEPGDVACTVFQESNGGKQCNQDPECTRLPGNNAGTYYAAEVVENLVIKAGKEYHVYESGVTEDGCFNVLIYSNLVSWEKVGSGKNCRNVKHAQVWSTPLCTAN